MKVPQFKLLGFRRPREVVGSTLGKLERTVMEQAWERGRVSAGDIHKEDRAWKYLFHAWLPGSGHQPADEPTLEVYRRHPVEVGWDPLDIDCCLPVRPMRRPQVVKTFF